MTNLDEALALCIRGWPILPLDGKVPAIPGGKGHLDATTDPEQIRTWWTRYPSANIGARVPRGLLVIDLDPRNGGDVAALEAGNEPLPDTLTVWSGRDDGGRHLYFRWSGGPISSRRLPAGIDVKTSSGYCVVPPSLHPATGRPYRWEHHEIAPLPAWLRALLRPKSVMPPRGSTSASGSGLLRFVDGLREGDRRNCAVFWAMRRAVENNDLGLLDQLAAAGRRIGLADAEVRGIIASALARGDGQ